MHRNFGDTDWQSELSESGDCERYTDCNKHIEVVSNRHKLKTTDNQVCHIIKVHQERWSNDYYLRDTEICSDWWY